MIGVGGEEVTGSRARDSLRNLTATYAATQVGTQLQVSRDMLNALQECVQSRIEGACGSEEIAELQQRFESILANCSEELVPLAAAADEAAIDAARSLREYTRSARGELQRELRGILEAARAEQMQLAAEADACAAELSAQRDTEAWAEMGRCLVGALTDQPAPTR